MPELPEVETFRRTLLNGYNGVPSLLDKEVESAELLWEGVLITPDIDDFSPRLTGQRVSEIGRRGKHLLIHFNRDTLILHPRMSGEMVVEPREKPLGKHYRLVVNFRDGYRFAFNNIRKFGRAWLVEDPESVLSHLGPEPLDDAFTPRDFHHILQKYHRQIKYLLLDQHVIAGLGNIYTDEALHAAKLHPRTKSDSLSFNQAQTLWRCIRKVLQEGIEKQGTSIDWVYQGGDFQHQLDVYQKEGEPCSRCATPIQKTTIAQRGTHFCPTCQPAPEDQGE